MTKEVFENGITQLYKLDEKHKDGTYLWLFKCHCGKEFKHKPSRAKNILKSCGSMFFSITFKKKSGEQRTLNVRDGVESKLALPKGQGSNNQEAYSNLITLFDVQAGHYKSVNLDTVTSLYCGNKVVWNKGE